MPKLLEQNGAEMAATLVSLAGPVKRFLEDPEIQETFKRCTEKGMKNKLEGMLIIYSDMAPLLFGKKHLRDTLSILAAVEGTTTKAMLEMNGTELIADAASAWKDQIEPFFMRLGFSV